MKEWAIGNHNNINFHPRNKVLVKSCAHFHHECWKRRCVVLHKPEVQQDVLKVSVSLIMEEASKEELSRHVQIHKINSNEASSGAILSWVRIIRAFKSRACKSEYQDMLNMLNVIVNYKVNCL